MISSHRTTPCLAAALVGAFAIVGGGVAHAAPPDRFTVVPASPVAGQPADYIADTDLGCGDVMPTATCTWTFDGVDTSGAEVSHTYATSGPKLVTLTVTDIVTSALIHPETADVDVVDPPSPPPPPPPGPTFTSIGVTPTPAPSRQQKSGPKLLSPFPRVRYAGRLTPRGVEITLFAVRAPKGSQIKAVCSRRCPASSLKRKARSTGDIRLRKLRGTYRPGAVLRISITKKDRIGKYARISIPDGATPRRSDKCLWPSSKKPRRCPTTSSN